MLKGILFALVACFIWGFIFLIPHMVGEFNALEVAFGRYVFYGLVSLLFLIKPFFHAKVRYSPAILKKALIFSLITSCGYYPFLVLSLRFANPAISALILGISPITIAFYGGWHHGEKQINHLLMPSILILVGLSVINLPHLMTNTFPETFLLGLLCSLVALSTWTWYAVANAKLLKTESGLSSGEWSSLMGVGTLVWVICFTAIAYMTLPDWDVNKYFVWSESLGLFLLGCGILGILCSWLGAYLWNKASLHLPVSLAGQLMIFETIFGLLFFYIYEQTVPPAYEMAGILILLSAVYFGVQRSFLVHEETLHA